MDLSSSSLAPMDDLRARHQAVVDLIYFTDHQATALLQLYVTVALAAGAGAITAFTGDQLLTKAAGWGLLLALAPLAVGCFYCLRASSTATLNLPGRGADFWKWASRDDVSEQEALRAYLDNLEAKQAANNQINGRTAGALRRAKQAGIAAAAVGVFAGLAAALAITWASAAGLGSSGYPNQSAVGEVVAPAVAP